MLDSSFVKHTLPTCGSGSTSSFLKGCFLFIYLFFNVFWLRSESPPDCTRQIPHKKRLIDTFFCIYSLIQYKLNLGFESNYIPLPSVIVLLQCSDLYSSLRRVGGCGWHFEDFYIHRLFHCTCYRSHWFLKVCYHDGIRWVNFNDMNLRVLAQQLRWQFGGVLLRLLVICSRCRGSSSSRCGFVILTSSCLGAHSSHSETLLGEVSSQSSIVNLLHVLLDFSFDML